VNLTGATNANISDAQGQGTITNDDLPTVSIQPVIQNEGNFGNITVSLTITLSAANPSGASVVCSTQAASALPSALPSGVNPATAGSSCGTGIDYIKVKGATKSFGPTETSKTCVVTICGDALRETDEAFAVTLSTPQGATIATGTAGVLARYH